MITNARISEKGRVDVALAPQQVDAAANATGKFFSFGEGERLLFVCNAGSMATTAQVTFALQQAKDGAGAEAEALTISNGGSFNATTGSLLNDAGNIHGASAATITCAGVAAADTIEINGVTLTAVASATPAAFQFDQTGTDTECATDLLRAINAHVPGVIASSAAAVVTIAYADNTPGALSLETSDNTNLVVVSLSAAAVIEVQPQDLNRADGFSHVALNAAVVGVNTLVSGTCIRLPKVAPATSATFANITR